MENATKALIIAGAILVAILLVTMGIKLLSGTDDLNNQSKSTVNMMSVEAFNGKIESAVGKNVSGGDVKQMLKNIEQMKREDEELKLEIEGEPTKSEDVKPTARYIVTIEEKDSGGYITKIKIEKKS